jgi:predicted phage terminase large subunit-like protein
MARRTPGRLAEFVTDGRRFRTTLWMLFDRVALALAAGLFMSALIQVPPQHGKSEYWSRFFPAWWIGRNPDHRVVLGAYGAQFAESWGREARNVLQGHGRDVFGVDVRDNVAAANEWKTVDGEGRERDGGMVTAGVDGGIAGRPAELLIADDIIADDQTAESQVLKDKVWKWWESEACARLQKNGRRIMLMTRRAVDDPPGRILKLVKEGREVWKEIKLPAIAEEDEEIHFEALTVDGVAYPEWTWRRKRGEALCPELHPLEELEATKRSLGESSHYWTGLRQQRPYPRGGGVIKGTWFRIVEASPAYALRARAWDLAYSKNPKAKRTAGVLMTKRREGGVNRYHIEEIVADRWGPGERNERIHQQAKIDGKGIPIILEEEGGSGGPTQVDELVRLLDGWTVIRSKASPSTGSKELRAMAMAGQAEVGNITIRAAHWNDDFINEVNAFPNGPTIDMVDSAAHAYNWLAAQPIEELYSPEELLGPEREPIFGTPEGGIFG